MQPNVYQYAITMSRKVRIFTLAITALRQGRSFTVLSVRHA